MLFAFLVFNILATSYALGFENTVNVPPNSQPNGGQQWNYKGCSDSLLQLATSPESLRKISDISSANILHGRTFCPGGKQFINGQCRNVWRSGDPAKRPNPLLFGNTVNVPKICPDGQQWINGGCLDTLLTTSLESHRKISGISSANLLHGRTFCPGGKQYVNGQCRDEWGSGDPAHPYAAKFGNTVNVPQNCPGGQRWINGECRDPLLKLATSPESHKNIADLSSANLLQGRTNCPFGKQFINGQCRDVVRSADLAIYPYSLFFGNILNVPQTCSGGQQWINGGCRDPLLKPVTFLESYSRHPYALRFGNTVNVPPNRSGSQQRNNGGCRDSLLKLATSPELHRKISDISSANLLHARTKCPDGKQFINGECRNVWQRGDLAKKFDALGLKNTIGVSPNCSDDKKWSNGACRYVSLRAATSSESKKNSWLHQQLKKLWNALVRKIQKAKNELEKKFKVVGYNSLRHMNLPNQCPFGFRVDALGICRPT